MSREGHASCVTSVLLAMGMSGCATGASPAIADWSTMSDGCRASGLPEVVLWPEDVGVQLHPTDILIGRIPDTGNGPGLLVHFRQGRTGAFAQSAEPPKLFMAVGSWNNSCSLLIDAGTCPGAADIYRDLAERSIPIGHAFDAPLVPAVIHGTQYFLSTRDGHGNRMDWSYVGIDHPLQDALAMALDSLAQCAAPAARAFQHQYPAQAGQQATPAGQP